MSKGAKTASARAPALCGPSSRRVVAPRLKVQAGSVSWPPVNEPGTYSSLRVVHESLVVAAQSDNVPTFSDNVLAFFYTHEAFFFNVVALRNNVEASSDKVEPCESHQ